MCVFIKKKSELHRQPGRQITSVDLKKIDDAYLFSNRAQTYSQRNLSLLHE